MSIKLDSSKLYVRDDEVDDDLVVHASTAPSRSVASPPSQNAIASGHSSEPTKNSHSSSSLRTPINAAMVSLSVISSVAMVIILAWFFRLRRREQLQSRLRLGSDRSSSRHTRSGGVSGGGSGSGETPYVLPLKTSFLPSLKSSFGFTEASPDSPWSRTEGTITPLTRAAGQEFLYSPVVEGGKLSPADRTSTLNAVLSPPPVTAITNRTFRTSIHSMMANRDSMPTHNPSLSGELFPHSKRPGTRLPSYHTDYAKSAPYSADLKKVFLPIQAPQSDKSSPSVYSSLGHNTDFPSGLPISKLSLLPPSPPPSSFKTRRGQRPRIPGPPVLAPIKTRQALKEYLDSSEASSGTASHQARVDSTFTRQSISSSAHHDLSDDLRGLIFLPSSVVVDDRPRISIPADPDWSPTQW